MAIAETLIYITMVIGCVLALVWVTTTFMTHVVDIVFVSMIFFSVIFGFIGTAYGTLGYMVYRHLRSRVIQPPPHVYYSDDDVHHHFNNNNSNNSNNLNNNDNIMDSDLNHGNYEEPLLPTRTSLSFSSSFSSFIRNDDHNNNTHNNNNNNNNNNNKFSTNIKQKNLNTTSKTIFNTSKKILRLSIALAMFFMSIAVGCFAGAFFFRTFFPKIFEPQDGTGTTKSSPLMAAVIGVGFAGVNAAIIISTVAAALILSQHTKSSNRSRSRHRWSSIWPRRWRN